MTSRPLRAAPSWYIARSGVVYGLGRHLALYPDTSYWSIRTNSTTQSAAPFFIKFRTCISWDGIVLLYLKLPKIGANMSLPESASKLFWFGKTLSGLFWTTENWNELNEALNVNENMKALKRVNCNTLQQMFNKILFSSIQPMLAECDNYSFCT